MRPPLNMTGVSLRAPEMSPNGHLPVLVVHFGINEKTPQRPPYWVWCQVPMTKCGHQLRHPGN